MTMGPCGGVMTDHTLVRWTVDGVTNDWSVHGHGDQEKAIAQA